ncbi:MAG: DUF1467 family protein [Hyphomicrobiales bacterium]
MSIASGLAIYFIIWWVVLFTILPFGVRSQHEGDGMALGTDRGAPIRARLPRKALTTTVVSLVVFAAFYYLKFEVGFGLDDIPFLPTY